MVSCLYNVVGKGVECLMSQAPGIDKNYLLLLWRMNRGHIMGEER
jgi:hypothetical protein